MNFLFKYKNLINDILIIPNLQEDIENIIICIKNYFEQILLIINYYFDIYIIYIY